ncbi:MAG: hypothetical protein RL348_1237 [Bacteroidota bacterium]|jgi:hypothetical protein
MPRYSKYNGQFFCQKCSQVVNEARFYRSSFDLTWMCSDKHLSKVNLYGRGY